MKITIRSHPFRIRPVTQDAIRTRVEAALGRLSAWISAVDVTVTDINGTRGGDDKHCILRLRSPAFRDVVIEQTAADHASAAVAAAERAKQTLTRRIQRRRVNARHVTV